jgi:tRNA 2-selenouridine synthase
MKSSPIIQMNVSKDVRVQRLVSEYGHADRAEFLEAMTKIIKRLGGQHFKAAKEKLLEGDMAGTIEILLTYYDKYYLESIESKKDRVKLILPWDGKDANTFAKSMSGDYANR